MAPAKREFRLSVRLTTVLMVFAFQDEIKAASFDSTFLQRSLILDSYEMPSPWGRYLGIRQGYSKKVAELAAGLSRRESGLPNV